MLWHYDECVDLKSALAAIAIHSFQEKAYVVLDDEESSPLPGREGNEVSSGR